MNHPEQDVSLVDRALRDAGHWRPSAPEPAIRSDWFSAKTKNRSPRVVMGLAGLAAASVALLIAMKPSFRNQASPAPIQEIASALPGPASNPSLSPLAGTRTEKSAHRPSSNKGNPPVLRPTGKLKGGRITSAKNRKRKLMLPAVWKHDTVTLASENVMAPAIAYSQTEQGDVVAVPVMVEVPLTRTVSVSPASFEHTP